MTVAVFAGDTEAQSGGGARLDTLAVVETPEGVVLRLAPAGAIVRALAQGVDLLLLGVVQVVLAGTLAAFEGLGVGIYLILGFVLQWLYPVLCEVLWNGQTIGKRTVGLRVVHDDGSPVRLPSSALRNLLLVVDLWFGAVLAFISMGWGRRFQRLGDLVAGTMVVHVDPRRESNPGLDVLPLATPLRLDVEEQRLLVMFAERAPRLSRERQVELAELLLPLHGQRGDAAVLAVQRMAAGILGPA